ncbi:MAG: serine--tRNA ligase [Simkania sp.]|nr:serine--tRNA ligase [Simkania sp.]
MLDIKLIRKHPQEIEKQLKTKDPEVNISEILTLDERIRLIKTEVEQLKSQRNHLSKEIGDKKRQGQDVSILMTEVSGFGDKIRVLDDELVLLEETVHIKLSCLPNLPADDVPYGASASENICLRSWGDKPTFAFPSLNHVELNEKLHLFDFRRAAKVAGSGWPAYRGVGARLEWALLNYMIDTHLDNGFTLWMPPHLAKPEIMYGSAQLPKFEKQLFKIHDEDYNLYLIPTAEVALNGLHYDEIFKSEELPIRYCAYTPCFRREAGAAGSQERGLIRVHQFNKVEMFVFAKPDESNALLEQMVSSAEEILKGLDLHYRSMLLCTGDMSFASRKTIDIEVWLPGQNRYYEVSSVSNCGDFQARRSQTRFRQGEEKPELVHTLNGSGLATSRLMVAILENNQQPDGSVQLPSVLHKYLNGMKELIPT